MSENTTTKYCPKCKQEYPATLEYFYRDRSTKDGLHSECIKCRLEENRQYRQIHKAERRQYYQTHKTGRQQYQNQYYKTIKGYLGSVWRNMLGRCTNPRHKDYKYYGARGLKVKFISFDDFYEYVVNELKVDPSGLTIDRINNDGHYERGNIRFVSQAVNNQNRQKTNRILIA